MINGSNMCIWYEDAGQAIHSVVYSILLPIYITFGITGHTFCLVIYYKNSKKENAYLYQIFIILSETMETLIYIAGIPFSLWSGTIGQGQAWFMSNYFLMWCSAHAQIPLVNVFVVATVLFSVAMVVDRIYAVLKPFEHKNANHKLMQKFVVAFSLAIAFLCGSFDFYRHRVTTLALEPLMYKVEPNKEFTESDTAIYLSHVRNSFRCFLIASLIICNIFLVHFFRSHRLKLTNSANNARANDRHKNEKTLIILAVSQSIFITLYNLALAVYHLLTYSAFDFFSCMKAFWTPIAETIFQLCSMCNFYIFLFTSKNFRHAVASVVRRHQTS